MVSGLPSIQTTGSSIARGAAANLGDGAGDAGRDEDAVRELRGLLHGAEHVSGDDRLADGDDGLELPAPPAVERGRRQPPVDHRPSPGVLAHAGEHRQGTLRAVEDRAEQTGAELDPEWLARVDHRLAGCKPRGVFVHLDHGVGAVEPDHLACQPGMSDLDDVVEARRRQPFRDDDRSSHAVDPAALGRRPAHVASPSRSNVIW